MVTKSPYKLADGSNCGTKDCSRGHRKNIVPPALLPKLTDDLFIQKLRSMYVDNPNLLDMEITVHNRKRQGANFENYIKPNLAPTEEVEALGHELDEDALALIKKFNEHVLQAQSERTSEENDALTKYSGIHFLPVREYITNPDQWRKNAKNFDEKLASRGEQPNRLAEQREIELQKLITDLDVATGREYKLGVPVWRGIIPQKEYSDVLGEKWAEELGYKQGETISFGTFTSTSIDPGVAKLYAASNSWEEACGIVFKIHPKRGTGLEKTNEDSHSEYSVQSAEREIVLPRDAKYKVLKVGRFIKIKSIDYNSYDNSSAIPCVVELEEI